MPTPEEEQLNANIELLLKVQMKGMDGYRGYRWCSQESDQWFDVLCSGGQEKLLLDELQSAQTLAVKADAVLQFCERWLRRKLRFSTSRC